MYKQRENDHWQGSTEVEGNTPWRKNKHMVHPAGEPPKLEDIFSHICPELALWM
jgi:hypothetical protein